MAAENDFNEQHDQVANSFPIVGIEIMVQHPRHVVIAVDKAPEK